jgi:Zn-dependent protease
MLRSFRLGSLLGFPIHVNLTFLLLLAVVGLTMGGAGAIAIVLLAFGSVILHELGHAVVARRLGVRIDRIELHFFGGAAQMTDQPRRARDEIAIAAAGPAVSFGLAIVSFFLALASGQWIFQALAWINFVLGVFNLIPALPMDGGRILRAALSRSMGFVRATDVSVVVARVFTVALAVYGLLEQEYYLAFLAVMLWFMTSAEKANARFARGFEGETRYYQGGTRSPERRWPPSSTGFVIHQDGRRIIIERLD